MVIICPSQILHTPLSTQYVVSTNEIQKVHIYYTNNLLDLFYNMFVINNKTLLRNSYCIEIKINIKLNYK